MLLGDGLWIHEGVWMNVRWGQPWEKELKKAFKAEKPLRVTSERSGSQKAVQGHFYPCIWLRTTFLANSAFLMNLKV